VLLVATGVNQNIIYENDHECVQKVCKHFVHKTHEVCWGISQSEGHNQELVVSITSTKGCLRDIIWSNAHLMISRP
jgi:hypothetical protein